MDMSIGDDIECFRYFRNSFVYGKFIGMFDNELRIILSNLKYVMVRIYIFMGECSRYNYVEELLKIDIL